MVRSWSPVAQCFFVDVDLSSEELSDRGSFGGGQGSAHLVNTVDERSDAFISEPTRLWSWERS